jgi:hypothetical protein
MPITVTTTSPDLTGTNDPAPIILIRGYGGLDVSDERKIAYQGFNDGTVYPKKRGENYIYEGLILRFLKSHWAYHDSTNVVGYYPVPPSTTRAKLPADLGQLDSRLFVDNRVVIDPDMAHQLLGSGWDINRTLWVFRYYDLNERDLKVYGEALIRLIDAIRALGALQNGGAGPRVNIIAHSMGGLIVRQAVQVNYPNQDRIAGNDINKIITLGTPHQGIAFQIFKHWLGIGDAGKEIEIFNPDKQSSTAEQMSFLNFGKHFPPERLLTVVGTNYRSYEVASASVLNRFFSLSGEYGWNYNRSDGLVKQDSAQIPGAHRTFVNKCHGGADSLVTSRETYEIAARFFFGNVHARLRLVSAKIKRGHDLFGESEFFFGVSVKPRGVDFDLFHQSAEAENCYGPFSHTDLSDPKPTFAWAGPDRLICELMLDTSRILQDDSIQTKDMVLRFDIYVGERDLHGFGFSDTLIFRGQYCVRAMLTGSLMLYQYIDVNTIKNDPDAGQGIQMNCINDEWQLVIDAEGFEGTLGIRLSSVA